MYDLIIKNALIADGSGEDPKTGCVAVAGDKIMAVEQEIAADRADAIIDADGLVLSSGFIDSHGHSDISLLAAPEATGKISQGVTTEISGNCGLSVFPVTEHNREHLQELFAHYNIEIDWSDITEYAAKLAKVNPGMNLASLCGHNTLRASLVGYEDVSMTDDDFSVMQERLRTSLKNGAIGFSIGLLYVPGKFAERNEFLQLGKVLAEFDKPWTSHLRSEGNTLLEAMDEFIGTAEEAGCGKIHISHLKTAGKANWHKLDDALLRIEKASSRVHLSADRYPYIESMTQLSAYMPSPYSDMDDISLMRHLNDAANFAKCVGVLDKYHTADDWARKRLVSTSANFPGWARAGATLGLGRNFVELSEMLTMPPADICARLLKEDAAGTTAASKGMSEDNMLRILQEPFVCCCTDESARPEDYAIGRSHPRGFGSFPEFFRLMEPILGVGETVRKMTSLPADIFGLNLRGRVLPGSYADLVLFDPEKMKQPAKVADFANPHTKADGIEKVWVNGRLTYEGREMTGKRNGKFL